MGYEICRIKRTLLLIRTHYMKIFIYCSEYIPSPERLAEKSPFSNISYLSADSQCINRITTNSNLTSTPSTISNLSVYLTNVNFVASSTVIYKATSVLSPLKELNTETINQSNIGCLISGESQEDQILDETLKPEETLQNIILPNSDDDITWTENTNYLQDTDRNSTEEDNIDVQENLTNNTEEVDHNTNEYYQQNQVQENLANNTEEVGHNSNEYYQQNQEEVITLHEEKKLTRKRKQNTSEWRRKNNKVLKNSGQAYEGCNQVQENLANNTEEVGHNSNEYYQQNQEEVITLHEEKKLTRKRKQNTSEWRRKNNKVLKNSGQAYEGCNTKKKFPAKTIGSVCMCKKRCGEKFCDPERKGIFDQFYSSANRENQWLYISRHVETKSIKQMTLDRKKLQSNT